MTTLGAENTYNIKYTLASEDNKVLHDIEIDDMGEHFIESADEDLATFKMDWPNDNGLCWGRVTEHPQDNDYFYTVTDGTSLNVTSGAVIESLVVDRLPLVGWDCWTNMDTVNNIFNMLDGEYTVTIGDYTFNMIDDEAHLEENIEQFKKALSHYGSKRLNNIPNGTYAENSVVFKLKNDIIDYKQVFPVYAKISDYKYGITEYSFLYNLQNIWNRVIIGQQSYIEGRFVKSATLDFNLALCNKLKRNTLVISRYEDFEDLSAEIVDGKNTTIIKYIIINNSIPVDIYNFDNLESLAQVGSDKDEYFACTTNTSNAKTVSYTIPQNINTKNIHSTSVANLTALNLIIYRFGALPESFFDDLPYTAIKTLSLFNVTEIGELSLNLPDSITKVELPNTLLKIGTDCFTVDFTLQKEDFSIVVPESVTEIGENAFRNVPKLYYKGTATGAPWGAKEVITEF